MYDIPGAITLLGASFTVPAVIITVDLWRERRRKARWEAEHPTAPRLGGYVTPANDHWNPHHLNSEGMNHD